MGLAPALAGGLSGFSVGAIQQAATNLIEGNAWYEGVIQNAIVGAVGGAVAGRVVGAMSPESLLPVKMLVGGVTGGGVSAGTQVAFNVAGGRPWNEGVGTAFGMGFANGAIDAFTDHYGDMVVEGRLSAWIAGGAAGAADVGGWRRPMDVDADGRPSKLRDAWDWLRGVPGDEQGSIRLGPAGDEGMPRRPGLPSREDGGWLKGQLTDAEFGDLQQMAARRGKRIVLSGSLAETDAGLARRYDPDYVFPDNARWRAEKPWSHLAETGTGDIDLWEGSNLTPDEIAEIRGFFPKEFGVDRPSKGYNLRRYPNLEAFGRKGHGAGALVFEPDGRVWRIPAAWQEGTGPRRVLIVGESSFEHSLKLREQHPDWHIVATSKESREALIARGFTVPESELGFEVLHDVDATQLHVDPRFEGREFDAIVFNNPYMEGPTPKVTGEATMALIGGYVGSARQHLAPGGEVHVNVTQRLLETYAPVRNCLEVPGNYRRFTESPYYAGRFGESPYFAPYTPRYTTGDPMWFYGWDPMNVERLLSFVFR